jgi:hypothetical protein
MARGCHGRSKKTKSKIGKKQLRIEELGQT